MCLILTELNNIYNNTEKLDIVDAENLNYDIFDKDDYSISIKLMKLSDKNIIRICVFDENKSSDDKMILSFKLLESNNDLSNEFEIYKNEINDTNLEDFLQKHSEIIKKNIF